MKLLILFIGIHLKEATDAINKLVDESIGMQVRLCYIKIAMELFTTSNFRFACYRI